MKEISIRRLPSALAAATALLLLASCAGGMGGYREAVPGSYGPSAAFPGDRVSASRQAVPGNAAAPAPAPAARGLAALDLALDAAEPASEEPTPQEEPAPGQPEARRRVYSGACRLLVTDREERKARIASLAETRGGYVESSTEEAITIRVPAGEFREIFSLVLEMGEVQHQAVETHDVTEAFNDLNGRLAVAEKTRQRLYLLLEKTTDVEERVKILREIKRLSEEIEKLSLTLQLLERQVAFSRISVHLTTYLARDAVERAGIPFQWIANLNPIYPSLTELAGRARLDLGVEFAVFAGQSALRAESPEGTRLRLGSTPNSPRGDARFWQKALRTHLGRYYQSVEEMTAGEVRAILLTSKDRAPYYYLVGVIASGDDLHVVEVFFPDEAARTRRLETVRRSLEKLEIQ